MGKFKIMNLQSKSKRRKTITVQSIYDEAKKYTKREDFKKGSPSHHSKAGKLGIYQDVVKHIPICALNSHTRGLYAFTWPKTMEAYVGLTWNYEERFRNHLNDKSSKVYKKVIIDGDKEYFIKTFGEKKYKASVAAQMEKDLISDLKKRGFKLLNGNAGGALGGSVPKWKKNKAFKVLKDAIKKFKEDDNNIGIKWYLQQHFSRAYNAAASKGWLKELWEEENIKDKNRSWTDEEFIDYCQDFKYRNDINKNNKSLYAWAGRYNKWHLVPHMTNRRNLLRTKEDIIDIMKQCTTSREFKRKYARDYEWCVKYKILQELYKESKILVSKSTSRVVKDTLTGNIYASGTSCAREVGMSCSTISRKIKAKDRFIII